MIIVAILMGDYKQIYTDMYSNTNIFYIEYLQTPAKVKRINYVYIIYF